MARELSMFIAFLKGWAKISKEEEYFTAYEKCMKFTFQPPYVLLSHSLAHSFIYLLCLLMPMRKA